VHRIISLTSGPAKHWIKKIVSQHHTRTGILYTFLRLIGELGSEKIFVLDEIQGINGSFKNVLIYSPPESSENVKFSVFFQASGNVVYKLKPVERTGPCYRVPLAVKIESVNESDLKFYNDVQVFVKTAKDSI
jgi:hypothetical protein